MHQYCFTYLMVKLRGMEMFRQSVEKSPKRRVGRTRAVGKHLVQEYPVRDVPEPRVRALR